MSAPNLAGMDIQESNDIYPHDHVTLPQSPASKQLMDDQLAVRIEFNYRCFHHDLHGNGNKSKLITAILQGRMLFAVPKKGRLYDKIVALLKV